MATLKTIITEYINLLDKPFDIALYRRVRQLVLNQRAAELKKQADRYGINNRVVQYINPEFEVVRDVPGITIRATEQIIRTTNKILRQAISVLHDAPYYYVGATDLSVPFMYVNNPHVVSRLRTSKHFERVPLYYTIQDHLYCVVNRGTIEVTVGHLFHDSGLIDLNNDVIQDEYYDDNYEFLISHDMLQTIKERLLKGELQVMPADDNEVKLNDDGQAGSPRQ